MASSLRKVALIGSGNWGTAIAKIIGNNVKKSKCFDHMIRMYVYEEIVDGQKLTDIINSTHENKKYLPGIIIPDNIKAVPSIKEVCDNADVFVFVIPHQFVNSICKQMKNNIKPNSVGISLIKGFNHSSDGIEIMSDVISKSLGINCGALMGANIAHEVAAEKFCESTIGFSEKREWSMWKELFHCNYFKVNCIDDVRTVELCGALKNAVAIGAGIVDALGNGDNTKAAIIRLGLLEMREFSKLHHDHVNEATFFESCGVADLITTCYGGRNRKVGEEFARTGKSFDVLEKEMLNGQKLQGPQTALQAYKVLQEKGVTERFPLLTSIYRICYENMPPKHLIETLERVY